MKSFANALYSRFATQNNSAFCFRAVLTMGIAAAISIFAFLGIIGLFIMGTAISVIILLGMIGIILIKNKISCNTLIQTVKRLNRQEIKAPAF